MIANMILTRSKVHASMYPNLFDCFPLPNIAVSICFRSACYYPGDRISSTFINAIYTSRVRYCNNQVLYLLQYTSYNLYRGESPLVTKVTMALDQIHRSDHPPDFIFGPATSVIPILYIQPSKWNLSNQS